MKIAVVVPTVREEQYKKFLVYWADQFTKYDVHLIKVVDGENPHIEYNGKKRDGKGYMGEYWDLIYNRTDAVRNLGFAFAYKEIEADVIFSFDDDVAPSGDTIGDHLAILGKEVSTSWLNTAHEQYVRGVPYGVRDESTVVVSHGVWRGVPDLDAPTQLVEGVRELTFPRVIVPKGVLFPMCAMNFAFLRDATPLIYQAPMGYKVGLDRFADIWGGIEMKKSLDEYGFAVATGYAYVHHTRASNVFTNLQKEAKGIEMNENYGADAYFKLFHKKRARWQDFIKNKSFT